MSSRAVAYAVTRRQDAPAPHGGTGSSSSERAGCRGPRWATSCTERAPWRVGRAQSWHARTLRSAAG
eukprot:6839274-Prymnesium_polylepis.1